MCSFNYNSVAEAPGFLTKIEYGSFEDNPSLQKSSQDFNIDKLVFSTDNNGFDKQRVYNYGNVTNPHFTKEIFLNTCIIGINSIVQMDADKEFTNVFSK